MHFKIESKRFSLTLQNNFRLFVFKKKIQLIISLGYNHIDRWWFLLRYKEQLIEEDIEH